MARITTRAPEIKWGEIPKDLVECAWSIAYQIGELHPYGTSANYADAMWESYLPSAWAAREALKDAS